MLWYAALRRSSLGSRAGLIVMAAEDDGGARGASGAATSEDEMRENKGKKEGYTIYRQTLRDS